MKRIVLSGLFFLFIHHLLGQVRSTSKPVLDTSIINGENIKKWPHISYSGRIISNNGQFISYGVSETSKEDVGILQSTNGNWRKEIVGAHDIYFTGDSRKAIYLIHDSLCTLELGTDNCAFLVNVNSYKMLRPAGSEVLLYRKSGPENTIILHDLNTGREQFFFGIKDYKTSDDEKMLAFIEERKQAVGIFKYSIYRLNLTDYSKQLVWNGTIIPSQIIFDGSGTRLAFVTATEGTREKIFWYYDNDSGEAEIILDGHSALDGKGLELSTGNWNFSQDGKGLFFSLLETPTPELTSSGVKVDIWTYTDPIIQSIQLSRVNKQQNFAAYVDLSIKKIIRLQNEDEEITFPNGRPGNIAVITKTKGDWLEKWSSESLRLHFIEEIKTGVRFSINMPWPSSVAFSPDGRYMVAMDSSRRELLSYEIATRKIVKLTSRLRIPLDQEYDQNSIKPKAMAIAGWLEGGKSVLVYDLYDIWMLDPSGIRTAINLTSGYGHKHRMSFAFAEAIGVNRSFNSGDEILLCAFNERSKDNGFFRITIGRKAPPILLSMTPHQYYFPANHFNYRALRSPFIPLKAKDSKVWLVERQSAESSPNLFSTTDFRKFKVVSEVYPEKAYNWLTSELFSFRSLNGEQLQGIIYKPEDFDPKRFYPVIINYYEKLSVKLHHYSAPANISDNINIPWFVSNGYIVVTPDIHFGVGHPGQCALNAVVGAVKYLAKISWADSKHIGLQGHSFGGFETNYIVAHSNLFAAAFSSSGVSDLISESGSISPSGGSKAQEFIQYSQYRIGSMLWKQPDLYIENSPVFFADKINTPLLMMNNKKDEAVYFSQGVEFFLALRRLGKRAWMLQYDGEGHGLGLNKNSLLQHTIRVTQFFDHYLKGALAPKWMVAGIPAKRKGLDDGLDLEPLGVSPGPGLLNPAEQKKVDALKQRKPIIIKFR